jgi:hypothetical protein
MKVIFLDNDGVICLSNNWGSRLKKQKKWERNKLSTTVSEMPVEYRFDNFDKKAIKILNEILEETDAEIVVSSDWRLYANIEELGEYYLSQGIIKKPYGVTEEFHYTKWLEEGFLPNHDNFNWHRNVSREQERHFEITRWLRDNPSVTQWVAIDDLNMGLEYHSFFGTKKYDWGLTNFVWTQYPLEGIKQSGIKDKVLSYLK